MKAQNSTSISIGAEFGLPSGNFVSLSGIGLGGSIKADFPISTEFALTVNGGIMNFFGKRNQLINVKDLVYIPLKAGLKYQLGEHFYAEAQLGAGLSASSGQKTIFVWSPGIGNQFKMAGKNKLDLGIRYEGWTGKNETRIIGINNTSTKGFVGIRLAYVFGL
ncbi:hypothetical protein [Pedobacter agri]|uniref:hypothetical protein n=1 Tax=Pedobacter agri TaxID=454586 RepID=UPI0027D87684|nr:hypothetical protein [Pedobacter agri]